ncbi:Cdk-activating kinase assembly factor [Trema orientale]|uniref:Cdk-activating kinase assembly factor n=1 Tax=Trema orientale TaxID=63057 RepID=A0A2P5FPL3_TREOI|nr:Cdk-activating kinase assembly factor [Trema orientale]
MPGKRSSSNSIMVVEEEKKRSNMDNIFKLDESLGEKEELQVLEPPKEVIETELFLHQKKGLWLPFSTGNSCGNDQIDEEQGGEHEIDNTNSKQSSCGKTTLIVCPPSVLSTWNTQLKDHTKDGSFKVYTYHGGGRTDNAEELRKYDIVLTTYGTLANEYSSSNSPVKEVDWWRVILDEGHMIRNAKALQTQSICQLKANRRWVVTGTPIQNDLFDLFSYMIFMKFEPFSIRSSWGLYIELPLSTWNEFGLSRLQVLMATISLRRTKDKGVIELPPISIDTIYVELSKKESEVYEHLEKLAENSLQGYIEAGSPPCKYVYVLSMILRLRQVCADLALCPLDNKTWTPPIKIEDVSCKPELLQKIVEVLQDGDDLLCPICINPPTHMVITRCGHIYCCVCILRALKLNTKSSCPLCRGTLTTSDLFLAPATSDNSENEASSSRPSMSSKSSALLKLLLASREQNSATKSVVFSQFKRMLILLEKPLKEAGFKTLRLDGSMNAKRRNKVVEEFEVSEQNGPTVVLLASLKASGTGINLTAASRVYLFEPWWNPAVERQAMDRVHRIGQKEEVKIVRLIARNSIEEKILRLQELKRKAAMDVFGSIEDRTKVTLNDLLTLLSH